MTPGKAAGLALGFVSAAALGIAIGIAMERGAFQRGGAFQRDGNLPVAVESARPAASSVTSEELAGRPRARRAAADPAAGATVAVPASRMSASEPRLHDRLKPVMNRGTRMTLAAEGFRTGAEFATVAHAARNTDVPFALLKHRVLNEGRSLADAIHEARPDMIDPRVEVARAQAEARADVAALEK